MKLLMQLFAVVVTSGYEPCPEDCKCEINSQSSLQVDCGSQNLTKVPEEIPVQTKILYLETNYITDVPDYVFEGMDNLTYLTLSTNEIELITNETFEGLEKLQHLNLASNNIYHIEKGAFRRLLQLKELNINSNRLTDISGLFEGLVNLEEMVIQLNSISDIEDGAFDELHNLIKLNIRGNRLTEVPTRVFAFLYNVKDLKMENNKLSAIHPQTLDDLHGLDYFGLASNPLKCDCGIIKLKEFLQPREQGSPGVTCSEFGERELIEIPDNILCPKTGKCHLSTPRQAVLENCSVEVNVCSVVSTGYFCFTQNVKIIDGYFISSLHPKTELQCASCCYIQEECYAFVYDQTMTCHLWSISQKMTASNSTGLDIFITC